MTQAEVGPSGDNQPDTNTIIQVPTEHASIIERAVALLKRGEQWIIDNIHAGVTTIEGLVVDPGEDTPE